MLQGSAARCPSIHTVPPIEAELQAALLALPEAPATGPSPGKPTEPRLALGTAKIPQTATVNICAVRNKFLVVIFSYTHDQRANLADLSHPRTSTRRQHKAGITSTENHHRRRAWQASRKRAAQTRPRILRANRQAKPERTGRQ
jgi:hypothetical protein